MLAGNLGNKIIVPIFIQDDLNGAVYLNMLQNPIEPFILDTIHMDVVDDANTNLSADNSYFQQYGATDILCYRLENG